jgi:hypothetical protein
VTLSAAVLAILCTVLPVRQSFAQQVVSSAGKDGKTVIGTEPWTSPEPDKAPVSAKVLYGPDDRHDVYEETSATRLQLAASTCGLLTSSELTNNGNGTYTIQTSNYTVSGLPACVDEPYGTQPTAMFCTGFMVGEDLVATAGHCYDSSSISSVRFVFGFQMNGPTDPVTLVNADQVYTGVEVVGRQHTDEFDYSIVRVDRRITAPGAAALAIRRSGIVPVNTNIGVIGHPSGLPLKIAFGATTRVDENSAPGFFVANLDTYAGNSGSPVFNAITNVVEGILVRGQDDFVIHGTCFNSNGLPDHPGGEEVSKALTFENLVTGVAFNCDSYRAAAGTVGFHVVDTNLLLTTCTVTISSSSGDAELATAGRGATQPYTGSIAIAAGAAIPGDGILQVQCGDTLNISYSDADAGANTPRTFVDTAVVDCVAPVISNVAVSSFQPDAFTVTFQTSEPTTATVFAALNCGDGPHVANYGTSFSVTVSGLQPCTTYLWRISATDEAGNVGNYTDVGGACFQARTTYEQATFLENFDSGASGWTHSADTGADQWHLVASAEAVSPATVYGYFPGTPDISDASLVSPPLPAGQYLSFYHSYEFESGYDAGVIEISTDTPGVWEDLGPRILQGGYTTSISSLYGNPLGGRSAWTGGTLGTMTKVLIDYTGIPANRQVRFRVGTDNSTSSNGWEIDDFKVSTQGDCAPAADLQLSATVAPDPIRANSVGNFLYAVTNLGPSEANNVHVELPQLPGITYLAGATNAPAGVLEFNGTALSYQLGNLPANTQRLVQITFRAGAVSTLQQHASVSSATPDPQDDNNFTTSTFNVLAPCSGPDLSGFWSPQFQLKSKTKKGITSWSIKSALQLENTGGECAGNSHVQLYLSPTRDIGPGSVPLKLVGNGKLCDKPKTRKLNLKFPAGTDPRNQYLVAVLDSAGEVSECDDTNNVVVLPLWPTNP